MFQLEKIVRKNILNLKPYSSARDEYKGKEGIFLDANENSLGSVTSSLFNRYPDPMQWEMKSLIAELKNIDSQQILVGNGSDEPIDLLIRTFCEPGIDQIMICPPTYGMYEVSADINNVSICKVPLTKEFQLDTHNILSKINPNIKLIFICSPNNPTANLINPKDIELIISNFGGVVVLDEAYIDFCIDASFITKLNRFPNLVILQTFSKAWGLAALRLGLAFASKSIIDIMNKVKPPYNINIYSQEQAVLALKNNHLKLQMVDQLIEIKEEMIESISKIKSILKIYPSDANFILIKINNATEVYNQLIDKQIIVRNRSSVVLCDDCLRITVGTKDENSVLISTLKQILG